MAHSSPGVLIYGAGGHGKVIADIVEHQARYSMVGFLDDDPELWGAEVFGYKVLGSAAILSGEEIIHNPVIIAIGDNRLRQQLALRLDETGYVFASAIHPSAQIGRGVHIGAGTVIMANVSINTGANIGKHVIVNTGAIVEHDCTIYDFVHISPAAALAGNVEVEEGAHLGLGCSILPNVRIGAYSVVGAGAVVTKNIAAGVTVVGVPAKPVSTKEEL